MSQPQPTETLPPLGGATEGGTYFVSNYPPYGFWRPGDVTPLPPSLGREPAPGTPLGIYVHIPFCRKRCHFCYFKVVTGKSSPEVAAYLEAVGMEARLLSEQPAFSGRSPAFLYVGGGTPSYLSERHMDTLLSKLAPLVDPGAVDEFTFECEPGTLSRGKLEALRRRGVTRLSLGVEHLDDEILALNGRAHDEAQVHEAYALARDVGFPQINVDLLAGLVGETDDGWTALVGRTIAMVPDSITIYQLEVPTNTTLFREMAPRGGLSGVVADWPTKRRWLGEAFDALEDAGYTLTSGYTAVRDPAQSTFVYRDSLWAGADMLGLGASAFSHVGGVHHQNETRLDPYMARLALGALPITRGYAMDDDERMIRQLVLQLKRGHIRFAPFKERYGVPLPDRFGPVFQALHDQGLATWDDDGLLLTREGLVQVDRLLPAFFLDAHRPHAVPHG